MLQLVLVSFENRTGTKMVSIFFGITGSEKVPDFFILTFRRETCAGLTPTTTSVLNDLEEKASVQHNAMTSSPVITDADDISVSSSAIIIPALSPQLKPDCNIELERSGGVAPPLAARHAQNPTVERNTHRGSSEELAVDGNTLVPRHATTAADQSGNSISTHLNRRY